jgi:hypothetical protein
MGWAGPASGCFVTTKLIGKNTAITGLRDYSNFADAANENELGL